MRIHKLNLSMAGGPAEFIVRTPSGIDKYKDWLDSALSHKKELLQISKEIDRIEEDVYLQAATEIEKDFYYLKENIETMEEVNGEEPREYICLPSLHPDGWGDSW